MASNPLVIKITESIFLNGYYKSSGIEYTIPAIDSIDNKIFTIPSGSEISIMKFTSSLDNTTCAGTFLYDNVKYVRITNIDKSGSLFLKITNDQDTYYVSEVVPSGSFLMTSTYYSSSISESFQINNISAYVGSDYTGSKNIEYYIASKNN